MSDPGPTRTQGDLAEMLEMLLDKGVVVNADIAVSIGDTELLGVQVRAAIASFETAAEYGLAFPTGTDLQQLEAATGVSTTQDEAGSDTDNAEMDTSSDSNSSERLESHTEPQPSERGG